ncbi:MAG TPA: helix-turn-helix domain-containing protein [Chloroflexota bacterium]|jgi:excisionase family DNA binding protein
MKLLTTREAAERMKVSEAVVRETIKAGGIRPLKVGTRWGIPENELYRFGC